MKNINKHTLAAVTTVAALVTTLVFMPSTTRAGDNGNRDDHGQQATINFEKWVIAVPNQPGLIKAMEGAILAGDAGTGSFTGEVLSGGVNPNTGLIEVVAAYHFTGSEHSFSALIKGLQPVGPIGTKGVMVGVVTDGWLKGHALGGEWTVIAPCGHIGNCFAVTLEIQRDSRD